MVRKWSIKMTIHHNYIPSSHVTGARFIEQSLQVAKNQILMSSSDTHMFIDNVQECNYRGGSRISS
jgi:hypothetical protein